MIVVVDYGIGNLASVRNAFRRIGAAVTVTADRGEIESADGIVLPGVGSAQEGMRRLAAARLDGPIVRSARAGTPLLGLCLGMQLLFDRSDEGGVACLGLLPGSVTRLPTSLKVPHIGWNQVRMRTDSALWTGLPHDPYFYFVHSYMCIPRDERAVAGRTEYGVTFCSAIQQGRVWGTQFHPERSGAYGLQLLRNFADLCAPWDGVQQNRKVSGAGASSL